MKRSLKYLILILLIFGAGGIALYQFVIASRKVVDTTPLPQGPLKAPIHFGEGLKSQVALNLRLNLEALQATVAAALPPKHSIQPTCNLLWSDLKIQRVSDSRIRLTAQIASEGHFSFPLNDVPFKPAVTVKDLRGEVSGEGDLVFTPEWEFKPNFVFGGQVATADIRPLIPDGLAISFINRQLIPGYANSLSTTSIPFKPMVEGMWQAAQNPLVFDYPTQTLIRITPKNATLKTPLLDAATNDLVFALGVEFETLALMDATSKAQALQSALPPLPPLTVSPDLAKITTLYLPAVAKVSDLAAMMNGQVVPWEDGSVHIGTVEASDLDGTLYLRIHFDAKLPKSTRKFSDQWKGTIMAQIKPAFDKNTRGITIQNFSFTSHTDSLLLDVLGPQLHSTFQESLKTMVNKSLNDKLQKARQDLDAQANEFLDQQRLAWLAQFPQFTHLQDSSKAKLEGLRLTPMIFEVREGYLLALIQLQATASITVE